MALKPYLQLVRLPNLFTAAADPLAGWLIAGGVIATGSAGRLGLLVAASVLIYAAGIVLNDVFDLEIDRAERPGRPLPSGRVDPKLAAGFGGIALGLGPLVVGLMGSPLSLLVAITLVTCVLGYDAGLKRTPIGPVVMGSCRSLNLLLGMGAIEGMGGPRGWGFAAAVGVFVAGVTWVSRSEVGSGRSPGLLLGLVLNYLGLIAVGVALLGRGVADRGSNGPKEWMGLGVLLVVGVVVNRANQRAYFEPVPATLQRAVKTGVLSLVWLDVAMVAGTQGPGPALVVAALWVPAFVIGRWLYST